MSSGNLCDPTMETWPSIYFESLCFERKTAYRYTPSGRVSPMQHARLGNTGLIVSRLAFGAMTFGSDTRFPAVTKVDIEGARTLVSKCLDAGINFFDTADAYAQGQ